MTCNQETTIRWVVMPAREHDASSLYFDTTRGHVLGFEQIPVESPYLETNKVFELTFHRPGIYTYKCLIFGNMQGTIEVLCGDDYGKGLAKEDLMLSKDGGVKSVCSIGASTDIDRTGGEEPGAFEEEKLDVANIRKIVEKYMKKAKWELPIDLALELDKIESDMPFYKEAKEEEKKQAKHKRNRNARRRQKVKKTMFLSFWEGQSSLFQTVMRKGFTQLWNRKDEIVGRQTGPRADCGALIKECMEMKM